MNAFYRDFPRGSSEPAKAFPKNPTILIRASVDIEEGEQPEDEVVSVRFDKWKELVTEAILDDYPNAAVTVEECDPDTEDSVRATYKTWEEPIDDTQAWKIYDLERHIEEAVTAAMQTAWETVL